MPVYTYICMHICKYVLQRNIPIKHLPSLSLSSSLARPHPQSPLRPVRHPVDGTRHSHVLVFKCAALNDLRLTLITQLWSVQKM